jgi:hypothetical protein
MTGVVAGAVVVAVAVAAAGRAVETSTVVTELEVAAAAGVASRAGSATGTVQEPPLGGRVPIAVKTTAETTVGTVMRTMRRTNIETPRPLAAAVRLLVCLAGMMVLPSLPM